MRKVLWFRSEEVPSGSKAVKGGSGLPVTVPTRAGSARYFLPVPGAAVGPAPAATMASYQGSVPAGLAARSGMGGTSAPPAVHGRQQVGPDRGARARTRRC
jgi:hypothetical protein